MKRLHSIQRVLEERILFDAAAAVTVTEATTDADSHSEGGSTPQTQANPITQGGENPAKEANDNPVYTDQETISDTENSEQPKSLIFIDQSVRDKTVLLQDLFGENVDNNVDYQVFEISENSDGINAITSILEQYQNIDSVHILSHAQPGELQLGNSSLTSENLYDYQNDFSNWQLALNFDADILIYGCNLAEGSTGVAFVETLADLTNADIAASTDNTGYEGYGGDYELEYSTGTIETQLPITTNANWIGLLAPVPTTTIDVPDEEFINSDITFTVSFDNSGPDIGYRPIVDIIIPSSISGVTSGTYLSSINIPLVEIGRYDATDGQFEDSNGDPILVHPFDDSIDITDINNLATDPLQEGDIWYYYELPFGSYSPDQPTVDVSFTGTLDSTASPSNAIPFEPENLISRGIFVFGNDPLNNPDTDAPIISGLTQQTTTPVIWTLTKTDDLPENETVTGPNSPVLYTIELDIAEGIDIDNIVINDMIPDNLAYINGTIMTSVGTITTFPMDGANSNNSFEVNIGDLTGVDGVDVTVTYEVYVPDVDANGDPVLTFGGSTDDQTILNTASVAGDYVTQTMPEKITQSESLDDDNTIVAKSLAIQKSNGTIVTNYGDARYTPGDVVEFNLNFQVSDYFEFDNLVIEDILGNGWEFDTTYTPTLTYFENGDTLTSDDFDAANYSLDFTPPTFSIDGKTTITFNVSSELSNDGLDTELSGDLVNDGTLTSVTYGVITYRAIIRENYENVNDDNGNNIDIGDNLDNNVTSTADITAEIGDFVGNVTQSDTSSSSVSIPDLTASKTIYAINGDTGYSEAKIQPGETITYRIQIDFPYESYENLVVTDYLPAPIFDASLLTLDDTPLDGPESGEYSYGPDNDFDFNNSSSDQPVITFDAANNSISFNFGSFEGTDPTLPRTLDLLFTVTATDQPFGDGLLLTNQGAIDHNNSFEALPLRTEIVQVELNQPVLTISKGIVAVSSDVIDENFSATVGPVMFDDANTTPVGAPFSGTITSSNLATNPIDSNVTGLDSADIVRFAIVIENTGDGEAYNLNIVDALPSGLTNPSLVGAYYGDGTEISNSDISGDLFDNDGMATDGIVFTDPAVNQGILSGLSEGAIDGSNIIILFYDATVDGNLEVNSTLMNEATLLEYGGVDGGNNYISNSSEVSDDATVTIQQPTITKSVVSTSVIGNGNDDTNQATIGERILYRLEVEVPEGVIPSLQIVDTLDSGLVFDSVDSVSVSVSTGITDDTDGSELADDNSDFDGPNVSVSANERTITFDFGDIYNNQDDNNDAEVITIEYFVRVANVSNSQSSGLKNNQAELNWTNTDPAQEVSLSPVNAPNVRIVEPDLELTQAFTPNTGIDAGDVVSYSATLDHSSANYNTDAFDLNIAIDFDPFINFDINDVTILDGNANDITNQFEVVGDATTGLTLQLIAGEDLDLLLGESISIDITDMDITSSIVAGTVLDANTNVTWTSLDGNSADERDGSNPSGIDNYSINATDSLTVNGATLAKTIDQTSIINANNSLTEAVIGEIVTYEVSLTLPEGIISDAVLIDTLDTGLTFVQLTSVTASSDLSTDYGDETFNVTNLDNGITINGQEVSFALGNISNANTDNSTPETLILQYEVIVDNIDGNISGEVLNNSAQLGWTNPDAITTSSNTDNTALTVIEPQLTITKDVAQTSLDVGDPVVYTIVISNNASTSDTDAYDVTFADTIPSNINVTNITYSAFSSNFTFNSGTNVLATSSSFDLALGDSVTITIEGEINNGSLTGTTVNNTADVQWTTLDNDDPNDGDDNNERTQSSSDSAEFELASASIEKTLVSTSIDNETTNTLQQAVIGEVATYRITLTFPEGLTNNVSVVDTLDEGLSFIELDNASIHIDSNLTDENDAAINIVAIYNNTTREITFTLGNIKNSDSNNGEIDQISFDYTVVVENNPDNQSATTLDNLAVLSWNNGSEFSTTPVLAESITVIEPELTVTKSIDDNTPALGQDVQYTIIIDHANTSETDAYDVTFSDVIPSELTNLSLISVEDSLSNDVSANFQLVGSTISTVSNFDLGLTDAITIVVEGTVDTALSVDDTFSNTAEIRWTSIDGTDVNERDGNDGLLDSGELNDYRTEVTEQATITNPDLAISKVALTSEVIPGGYIEYQLTAENNGNIAATDIVVVDNYTDSSDTSNNSYLTFVSATSSVSDDSDAITWNIASLNPGDTTTVTLRFQVNSDAEVAEVIGNEVTIDSTADGYVDPTPGDNSASVNNSVSRFEFTKTLTNSDDQLVIGEVATYELVITVPEADIEGVTIEDILDSGLRFEKIVSVVGDNDISTSLINFNHVTATTVTNPITGQETVTYDLGDLINNAKDADIETITLRYEAIVENIAANQSETNLNNEATLLWTNDDQAVNPTAQTSLTIIEPVITIDKTVNDVDDASDTVVYTITIDHDNTSKADGYDLVFTDIIPEQLNFDFDNDITIISDTGNNITTNNFSYNSTTRELSITDFDLGLSDTIEFTISSELSADTLTQSTISNSASITWSSINGDDANERNGSGGVNDYSDSNLAEFTLEGLKLSKAVVSTSLETPNNLKEEVTIGETAVYQLSIEVPEGVSNSVKLFDTLDPGLEFVSLDNITVNGSITTSLGDNSLTNTNNFMVNLTGDVLSGQNVEVDLGNITNSDDDSDAETIVITYTVLTQNVLINQSGDLLNNTAEVQWNNGIPLTTGEVSSPELLVIEPRLQVITSAEPIATVNDRVVFAIVINHTPDSETDAYNIDFRNIPSRLIDPSTLELNRVFTNSGGNITNITSQFELVNGIIQDKSSETTNLELGDSIVLLYSGKLFPDTASEQPITSSSEIGWRTVTSNNPLTNEPFDFSSRYSANANVTLLFTPSNVLVTPGGLNSIMANPESDMFNWYLDKSYIHLEELTQYHFHERIISIETMEASANLVGGRSIYYFDNSFGATNDYWYNDLWRDEQFKDISTDIYKVENQPWQYFTGYEEINDIEIDALNPDENAWEDEVLESVIPPVNFHGLNNQILQESNQLNQQKNHILQTFESLSNRMQ